MQRAGWVRRSRPALLVLAATLAVALAPAVLGGGGGPRRRRRLQRTERQRLLARPRDSRGRADQCRALGADGRGLRRRRGTGSRHGPADGHGGGRRRRPGRGAPLVGRQRQRLHRRRRPATRQQRVHRRRGLPPRPAKRVGISADPVVNQRDTGGERDTRRHPRPHDRRPGVDHGHCGNDHRGRIPDHLDPGHDRRSACDRGRGRSVGQRGRHDAPDDHRQ